MNNTIDEKEIDEFFDWLASRVTKPKLTAVPPPPSFELLRLVRKGVKAYSCGNAAKRGRYEESLTLLAADDGSTRGGAVRITSASGKWDLIREILPDDPDWQILKLKSKDDFIAELQGSSVEVEINGQIYELGEINRRGVAETEVPSALDLTQAKVRIDFPEE
jgi:hypothetical protein